MKFTANNWTYTANDSMTSNWGWPNGRKGERVRINKKQFIQLMREQVEIYNNEHVAFLAKLHNIEL